jgi:hypothetical protein
MHLPAAIEAIEYKLATESGNFESKRVIKMDITEAWPPLTELTEALQRRFPGVSFSYDHQANDKIQLLIQKL